MTPKLFNNYTCEKVVGLSSILADVKTAIAVRRIPRFARGQECKLASSKGIKKFSAIAGDSYVTVGMIQWIHESRHRLRFSAIAGDSYVTVGMIQCIQPSRHRLRREPY